LGRINVDIEEFKRLHADGMTNREIANILGFSINTARKIRCNLGLPSVSRGRKSSVAVVIDDKELRRLCEKGLSDKEIGSVFDVSANTIFNQRQSLGLSRLKKWEKTAFNIEKFKQLHAEGLNDRKIGNVLGICIDTSRKIRHDLGLPPQALSRKHVDTEELKNLLAKGLTDEEIGAVFGVSAYTVYERRRDLGLFRRKNKIRFENINIDDFKRLYTEGMSDTRIAKALDVQDHESIREIRRQLGLAPNQGRFHEKKRELYDAGMSDGQIARIIKGSKKSITSWRRNHGLPPNKSDDALLDVCDAEELKPGENETIQPDSNSLDFDAEFNESLVGKATKKKTLDFSCPLKKTDAHVLKKLFIEGLSDAEIGRYFGVCDRTISNRRRSLGLYRQKPRQIMRKKIDVEELKQLYLAGMNDVEIGKALDISQSIVFRIRHNLGLASNRGRRHWEMRELYDLGLSDSKIAKILKVRKHAVNTWRQSHELPANDYDDEVIDIHYAELTKPEEEEPIQIDSESLFCDTEFLENYLGKDIKGNL
jgi:DNA-binding CsgD family transcriptional regulator/DNA-directed RNA polymerase specialized sigma24 family protein